MSWMIDITKLDDSQRLLVSTVGDRMAPFHIDGPAGSGKSVMLVHCARKYAEMYPGRTIGMVLFTNSLIDMMRSGIGPIDIELMTVYKFKREDKHWDLLLVDEVQDVEKDVLKKLKSSCKSLVVAGDFNQCIYETGCTASDLYHETQVELKVLSKIYRLTRTMQKAASRFTQDPGRFLEFSVDQRLSDVTISLQKYDTKKENLEGIWQKALDDSNDDRGEVAILLSKNDMILDFAQKVLHYSGHPTWDVVKTRFGKPDYNEFNEYLDQCDVPLQIIGRGAGSMDDGYKNSKISLLTLHSAKGLDFRSVYLPFISKTTVFWRSEELARRLFFVGLTRSRRRLSISYVDKPHPFLDEIDESCFFRANTPTGSKSGSVSSPKEPEILEW